MSFVPEPHIGEEEIRARADGRFGYADCFQWPQLYCKEYEFAICVRRREYHLSPDPLSWAWYRPTLDDFESIPTSPFLVGKLKEDKALGVASLRQIAAGRYAEWRKTHGNKQDVVNKMLQSLDHDIMILLNHPITFRDLTLFVAQAQRYFLDIIAFLDYVQEVLPHIANPPTSPRPVRADWMGCFTADTKTCHELFYASVPVWLVRHHVTITHRTIIEKPVKFTFPDDIIRAMYSVQGQPARPFDCLYRGANTFKRHFHNRRHYMGTSDPSANSEPLSQTPSQVGKIPTQAQARKAAQKARLQSGKGK